MLCLPLNCTPQWYRWMDEMLISGPMRSFLKIVSFARLYTCHQVICHHSVVFYSTFSKYEVTYSSLWRLQSFRREEINFTSDSLREFCLRSSSFSAVGQEDRANAKATPPSLLIPHDFSLRRDSRTLSHIPIFHSLPNDLSTQAETMNQYQWTHSDPQALLQTLFTYISLCILQPALLNRAEISFTPASPTSFLLKSSSTRCVGFDVRAEVRSTQPSFVRPLLLSLQTGRREKTRKTVTDNVMPAEVSSPMFRK